MNDPIEDPMEDYWIEGRWEELIPLARAQLETARKAGDRASEADVLGQLVFLFSQTRRPQEADRAARRELQLRHRLGDPLGLARAQGALAAVLADQDREAEALGYVRQALATYRGMGPALASRLELAELGQLLQQAGRLQEARDVFREALAGAPGDSQFVLRSAVLRALSGSHEALGDLPEAIRCQHEAVEARQRAGLDGSDGLRRLAELHLKAGRQWQAEVLLQEAVASARMHGQAESELAARQRLRGLAGKAEGALKLRGQVMPFRSC